MGYDANDDKYGMASWRRRIWGVCAFWPELELGSAASPAALPWLETTDWARRSFVRPWTSAPSDMRMQEMCELGL